MELLCVDMKWIREAMIRRCLAMIGMGEAWTGRAAERQRKDVTCKGDEWPGKAADEHCQALEKFRAARFRTETNRNS